MTTDPGTSESALDRRVHMIHTREDFDQVLSEVDARTLVLIEFFADWCGPCKLISSKLEEWAGQYEGKIVIMKVDVDSLEDLAMEHNVTSMPTFVFMKNRKPLETLMGSNLAKVEKALEKHCGIGEVSKMPPSPTAPTTSKPSRTSTVAAKAPAKK